VERIAQRILRELAQPLTAADLGGARLTASLGVVMAPEHGRDPEWLMRLADRAMYDAKVEGGDRVVFSANSNGHLAFTRPGGARARFLNRAPHCPHPRSGRGEAVRVRLKLRLIRAVRAAGRCDEARPQQPPARGAPV